MTQDTAFWDAVDALRARNQRYAREAYAFVVGALGATVRTLPSERLDDPRARHLSGGELLEGVVRLARQEFGPLAPTVFGEWGVRSGEDVGRIVFELVETGQLSARPEDTVEDFRGVPDLMASLANAATQGKRPAPPGAPPEGAA